MGMAQPSGIPQMHGGGGALPQQLLLQQQALQAQQRHVLPQLGGQVSCYSLSCHVPCTGTCSAPALLGLSLFGPAHSRSRQSVPALLALGAALCTSTSTCCAPAAS